MLFRSQLLEATDEGFLVSRFMRGIRDKAIRQLLAIGQDDLSKVTVGGLNQKIRNLTGAGEDSDSNDDTEESEDESGEYSTDEDEYRKHRRKSKKKSEGKALKKAQKAIADMEEKIKLLTSGANRVESLAVQQATQSTFQTKNNSSGQKYGQGGAQYTCYGCGMPGHMARFCPDKTQRQSTRNGAGATILFPGENGPQRMMWVDHPPNRLAPGYYPVEPLPQGENRIRTSSNRFQANNSSGNKEPATTSRITELKEVAHVDIVSSAAERMSFDEDVVRYVNAVEDVFVTGCR